MTALKKRLALLVIDMQEHFRPVTGGIIDNINSLINVSIDSFLFDCERLVGVAVV